MSAAVDYTAVDDLVEALNAVEGLTAAVDPADVRTPGVWVHHLGFSMDLIGGYTHRLQLHLVVADNGYARSRDALAALFTLVLGVVSPTDDPFFLGLVLPSTPKALPGLVVPHDLITNYA